MFISVRGGLKKRNVLRWMIHKNKKSTPAFASTTWSLDDGAGYALSRKAVLKLHMLIHESINLKLKRLFMCDICQEEHSEETYDDS